MAEQEFTRKSLTEEEIQEMTKNIADDPENEEETHIQLTGNHLYDRWAADDESINECGHL